MRYFVFLLAAAIIIFSKCCSSINDQRDDIQYIANPSAVLIEGIKKSNPPKIDSFATIELIPLETNEKSLLASVSKILVNEKLLYVLDEKLNQVLIFEGSGKFVGQVGAIGSGPDEYLSVEDIAFNSDTTSIFLLSNNSMKITEYGLDGTLKQDIYIGMYASKLAVDSLNNFYLFVNKNISEKSQNYDLIKLKYDGSLIDRYFAFSNPKDPSISYAGFVALGKDKDILFNNSFSDTVYAIQEGYVTPKYVFVLENEGSFSTNTEFTNDIERRSYLELPFLELQNGFLFLFASDNRVRPIVSDYTGQTPNRVLSFPMNSIVGYDKMDNVYSYVSPAWLDNDKDTPYVRRALEKFPILASVLEHSDVEDNPIIIKFSF